MIVATAGHVDHGKTTLVKALTGVDTDRAPEEKRRGMSIDLGFAYAQFGDGQLVGFVDVPGHERFVRNMLAGVAAIDLVLLVVAADDGPMPQTREHLAMVDLLGVKGIAVALTKIDRVAPERVVQAREEVASLLAHFGRGGAPVFPICAIDGAGMSPLSQFIAQQHLAHTARVAQGHFRLAVDRCFTVAGAGVVVTGAVLSGQCKDGDTVLVSPQGVQVRVRGIRWHDRPVTVARAGERCALNLAGPALKRAQIGRGDWLVASEMHMLTFRVDAWIRLLAQEPGALVDGTRVHLHIGAASCQARVNLLQAGHLPPGSSAWSQLVLETPIHAVHGDGFILRDASATRTLAGGIVVDPVGATRGRSKPARLAQLAAMLSAAHGDALSGLLGCEPHAVDLHAFSRARNLREDELTTLVHALDLHVLVQGATMTGVSRQTWSHARDRLVQMLVTWHGAHPESLGPTEMQLARALGWRVADPLYQAVIKWACGQGQVVRDGFRIRHKGHCPKLDAAEAALWARIAQLLAAAGTRPPVAGDLALQVGVTLPNLLVFLQHAEETGHLVRVAKNRWFSRSLIDSLVCLAHDLCLQSDDGKFGVRAFCDRCGLGRNLTIELLEFLDRSRVTWFDGNKRSIRNEGEHGISKLQMEGKRFPVDRTDFKSGEMHD